VNKRIFVALTIAFTGACAFLFNSFYKEAKNSAITKLNEEQMIHAKQAARGIEDFFATWLRDLNSLSKVDEIIDTDAVGKRYLKLFYEAHQDQIRSITRLDERGVILYNFPSRSSVGTDISDQKHVRELLRVHKPVISDVFKAVEGFDAIALHVPIFKGSVFKGSVGILINFESLARRYLDVIKIGETGYAWVISRNGTLLYSPISGFTGKSVFETIKDSPSFMAMVNDMLKGHEGAALYNFDRMGDRNGGQSREYAVYMPVHIGNTFWSIAVASAERDVLSGLISLRSKLAYVIGALFLCGMVISTLGAKAWFIVKEEEKRKQAEKKLQASEQSAEKFSTLFHTAPFAMALATTPDGALYDVNNAWLDLAGFTRKEEVVGKSSAELGVIRDAEPRERILNEFRQHGSVRNVEIVTDTKAGAKVVLLANLDWVNIGGRKFILSSTQDITDRKRAEETLRESEGRHRLLAETMLQGVVHQDANGEIIEMNPAAERILGKSREQFLGSSTVREERDTIRENGERFPRMEHPSMVALQTGLPVHGVIMGVFNPKIDDYRWISVDAVPVFRSGATRPSEVYSVFEDITERKKAEEVQGRLAAIVESAEDAIIGKDLNGIIQTWNLGAENIFGYKAEEVIGKPVSLLVPPGQTDEVPAILARIKQGELIENFETVRMRKDGTIIPVSLTFSAIKDTAGRVIGASKIAHDITERKKAEEEINRRTVELEEANRELESFSYSVSHDLRAPLRHMTGFAELLEKRSKSQLDETSLHYVSVISQAARKMGILIDDLLAFSRIGRTEIQMKTVSLTTLVREVLQEMDTEVEGRDIVWKIGELSDVYGDPSMLKLAVANLISNAVKFTRTCPRAEIEIGCREKKDESVFFVEDNGVGFDMKYGDKLFGVFQRLHPQGEFEGTGIGLANVRRIISRHCGRTWAEGSPGEGATFYFTLPKIKET
jgi:PAS domain S-box-containing protein